MILLSAVPDNSELLVRIVETLAVCGGGFSASIVCKPEHTFHDGHSTHRSGHQCVATECGVPGGCSGWPRGITLDRLRNGAVTVSPPSLGSSGAAPNPEAASSELTATEPSAVAIAPAGARLTTQVEVAAPGVSVGPLVTRGSAPLRPPLGTTPAEPTPSIDRNERAFDLAALESGAELDAELLLGLTTNRSDGNGEDTPVNQATRTTEPLIALCGPGGLPVMVSSMRVGQSLIDPAAVLATLPAPENLPDPGQQLARLPALPPLEISGLSARR